MGVLVYNRLESRERLIVVRVKLVEEFQAHDILTQIVLGVCQRSCRVIRILGGQPAWHFHPFRIQRHEALGLPIARVA